MRLSSRSERRSWTSVSLFTEKIGLCVTSRYAANVIPIITFIDVVSSYTILQSNLFIFN